jgi:hypothetical protein
MLPWAEEEKEANDQTISNGLAELIPAGLVVDRGLQQWYRDWLHSVGCWVVLGIGAQQLGNSWDQASGRGKALVYRTHVGKRLPNRPEVVFHCATSYGDLTGAVGSSTEAGCENLEKRKLRFDVAEEVVDPQRAAEFDPPSPMGVLVAGSLRYDAGSLRRLRRLVVSVESISGRRCNSFQGCACGYSESKWASSAASER